MYSIESRYRWTRQYCRAISFWLLHIYTCVCVWIYYNACVCSFPFLLFFKKRRFTQSVHIHCGHRRSPLFRLFFSKRCPFSSSFFLNLSFCLLSRAHCIFILRCTYFVGHFSHFSLCVLSHANICAVSRKFMGRSRGRGPRPRGRKWPPPLMRVNMRGRLMVGGGTRCFLSNHAAWFIV